MWLPDEWFNEHGFKLNEAEKFVKLLRNGCKIGVDKNQLKSAPFHKINVVMFEPDGRLSIISFGSERECGLDPVDMFSALLKLCEEKLLKI